MYTREQVKAVVDKILNMAKADAVEVNFRGGETSGTRWANSSITVNLVQFDLQVSVTVRIGQKAGTATTRDITDAGLRAVVDEATANANKANDNPNLPALLGPQQYINVDAALPSMVNYGPGERARHVKTSVDIATRLGVLGAGFIPKVDITTCAANSAGLFAYFRNAEAGFGLTCRMADGSGSGWAGISGIKDPAMIDAALITNIASDKAKKSRAPRAVEPGRYTVILEPRANARFLSLVTGVFNNGGGGRGFGGNPAPGEVAPIRTDSARATPADTTAAGRGAGGRAGGGRAGGGGGGAGGGGGGGFGGAGAFMAGKKPGDKIFSDLFTLKSDIGNPILRQTPIMNDNKPAAPVTWVENGVLRNFTSGQPANLNMSLVQEGSNLSIEDMIKQTRRGLLVTQLWYIRGVPAVGQPLLNTGMTRDGLFLIENGEIVGPVQNFRWNMSPLVGYNNLTLVGKPVPITTSEEFDNGGTVLVPPVRIEEFFMTSVSPAVAP